MKRVSKLEMEVQEAKNSKGNNTRGVGLAKQRLGREKMQALAKGNNSEYQLMNLEPS